MVLLQSNDVKNDVTRVRIITVIYAYYSELRWYLVFGTRKDIFHIFGNECSSSLE